MVPHEIAILLVDNAGIATFNNRWLGHGGATDVLSWPDGDINPETGRIRLGDIMASAEMAETVSAKRQTDANLELCLYAVHGLLHLLGMDDADEQSRQSMNEAAKAAFDLVGLKCPPLPLTEGL